MTDDDIINLARQHLSVVTYFDRTKSYEGASAAIVAFARAVLEKAAQSQPEHLFAAMAARAEIDPARLASLPRKLLDVACRMRGGDTLFRDDDMVDLAAHAIKAAALDYERAMAKPAAPASAEAAP